MKKIIGKSICPFCHGCKITPFVGGLSQNCSSCDDKGMIDNKWLYDHDLEDWITDKSNIIIMPKVVGKEDIKEIRNLALSIIESSDKYKVVSILAKSIITLCEKELTC